MRNIAEIMKNRKRRDQWSVSSLPDYLTKAVRWLECVPVSGSQWKEPGLFKSWRLSKIGYGTEKYVKQLLLLVTCFLIQNYTIAQLHKPAQIELADGASFEWLEDGSVKVEGTATFISPIKYYSTDNGPTVNSKEMVIVDPDFYASKSYSSIDPISGVKENFIKVQYSNPASEGGRWFIELKAEEGAEANSKLSVIKRVPLDGELDGLNNIENNFGFDLSSDDWLIFGGEYSTTHDDFVKDIFDLQGFERKPFGSLVTGQSYKSSDYPQLFKKWHAGSGRWWSNAVDNHPVRTALAVGSVIYIPISVGADAAIIEELSSIQEISEISEDMMAEAIKRSFDDAAFIRRQATIASKARITAAVAVNAIAAAGEVGLDHLGQYFSDKNTFFDVPFVSDYVEIPAETATFLGSKTNWWQLNPKVHPCVTEAYKSGDDINPNPCKVKHNIPVVVKLEVTDAVVKSISFPGGKEDYTPYELFGNLAYSESETMTIVVHAGNSVETTPLERFGLTPDQVLPKRIFLPTDESVTYVTLEFDEKENGGLSQFYLVSNLNKAELLDRLPASETLIKYVDDLGSYLNPSHNLYKVQINALSVNLTIDEGTFLATDNIILENHQEHENIVIANGSNQGFWQDENQAIVEDAELTINGDVLIYDINDKDNQEALLATENYQFYIGAKEDAVGMVSEDYAIVDRGQFLLPDFVFEEDYAVTTLDDLEIYIKEYKHLPHVPGQAEVDSSGHYSIPRMMMGQLQNLEELYMHAFKQEETITRQAENAAILKDRLQAIQERLEKFENPK